MGRYSLLLRYMLRRWPTLAGILGLTAVSAAAAALQPWPIKIMVDYALGDNRLPTLFRSVLEGLSLSPTPIVLIITAALASLGLFVVYSGLQVGITWAWAAAGQRMIYDLAGDLFHRLQRLSLLFHGRRSVGDSLNRLTGDTWCVHRVTESLLIAPGRHVVMLVTVGAVAYSMDPVLTLVSLGVAPLLAGSAFSFGGRLKRNARKNRVVQSKIMSLVHQTLTAIPVVQAFSLEQSNQTRFKHLSAEAITNAQHNAVIKNAYNLINGLTTTTGMAVVLYLGGLRVLSGALSVGSLLVFVAYLRSMQNAWQGLLGAYSDLKSVEPSIERVLEILDTEEGVRDRPGARVLPPCPAGERGQVQLRGVTFGYEPGVALLKEINLEARPGETVALVGPTGAGKSTLVSLIPRFFDPWEGQVLLDGIDIRDIQLTSLRAQIALVLQEPFLLPLSIAENIAYGRPGASHDQIVAAAVAAHADPFIRQLPQGYDTVIGERGATLSGGERQRLAIARAFLKDAPILILDEPTSALDAQTEAYVMAALARLMQGRTTFIIAHRLSTIRRASRIAVLEAGRIVEQGTHQDLLVSGGLYHKLHGLQSTGPPAEVVA